MMTRIRNLREAWGQVWVSLRFPRRRKQAWINVTLWTLALTVVAVAVAADLITKSYLWLAWNLAVGVFDFLCLHRSIEGLLWLRQMDRWAAVLRSSPGRGSTGE